MDESIVGDSGQTNALTDSVFFQWPEGHHSGGTAQPVRLKRKKLDVTFVTKTNTEATHIKTRFDLFGGGGISR